MKNADSLGIDHVSYALFDFSLSFLIYLVITFLVNLYATGVNTEEDKEVGYAKLPREENGGPEEFELEDQSMSGDEDAVKIGTEDEVDWMGRDRGVRL